MQRESLHCGELIKRLNDILGRCANEELRADDMTSSQVKMLMIINETKDECITLKELEKHFGVAQATIAGTAARLEKKGMIESFYDPSDKRVKHVRITDKGRAMCVHAGKAMHDKEKWFLSALSADEKEELINDIPIGRFGTVDEVANTVLFLCQNNTSYLTGQIIRIDGGFL